MYAKRLTFSTACRNACKRRDAAKAASRVIKDSEQLRGGADRLHRRRVRRRTGHKELVIVHVAIHASRDLRCFGPKGRTPTLQEDHNHNTSYAGIGVRGEPAIARALVRARP